MDRLSPLRGEESSHSNLTSFLKGSAFSACGLGIAGVLTMLTGVIFARWLKPEGFGIYSLVLAMVTFGGGFGAFGMDYTVARYVCYYLGTGEKSLIRSVVKYTLRRAIWISAVLAVALFAVLRGGLLMGTKLAVLAPFAGCVALAIPAMAVLMVLLQAILAMQAVRTRVVLEKVLYPLLRLLLPFGLLWLFRDKTMAAVAGVLLSALLLTAVSAVVLRGRLRPLPASAPATSPVAKEWSGYALPYVFSRSRILSRQAWGLTFCWSARWLRSATRASTLPRSALQSYCCSRARPWITLLARKSGVCTESRTSKPSKASTRHLPKWAWPGHCRLRSYSFFSAKH